MKRYSKILQQPTNDQTLISYYKNPLYLSIPINTNDIYVITTSGDRLDLLSTRFYNSSQYYWIIALANPNKTNPGSLFIAPGTQIRIPSNLNNILSNFQAVNS